MLDVFNFVESDYKWTEKKKKMAQLLLGLIMISSKEIVHAFTFPLWNVPEQSFLMEITLSEDSWHFQ